MKLRHGKGCQATLIGGLKAVPEIREGNNGTKYMYIELAIPSVKYDVSSNKYVEHTEWFTVCLRDQAATFIEKHGRKGMALYIEATIKHKQIELIDQTGQQRRFDIPEFTAKSVQPIGQSLSSKHDENHQDESN